MSVDLFISITDGIRFNNKRHRKTIQVFQNTCNDIKKGTNIFDDIFSIKQDEIIQCDDERENENENEIVYLKDDKKQLEQKTKRRKNLNQEDEVKRIHKQQEEINAFRNKMNIKVKGNDIPPPVSTFSSIQIEKSLKDILLQNIEKSDWKEPTPIQMQAIPILLAQRDVVATAPTGSGKTAAYLIPILSHLCSKRTKNSGLVALILVPTRELTEQIHRELLRLSSTRRMKVCVLTKKLVLSMMNSNQGRASFNHYQVMIATPMRLLTVIRNGRIDLSTIEFIVLDEADRLFEVDASSNARDDTTMKMEKNAMRQIGDPEQSEGIDNSDGIIAEQLIDEEGPTRRQREDFLSQIDEVLASCPSEGVQRALFSATMSPFVKELAESFLKNNPVYISIGQENTAALSIDQKLTYVGREDGKLLALRQLIQNGLKPPVLLFVQSVDRAKELFRELVFDGIQVDVMYAEKSDNQREDIMNRFRTGEIWVLICTDLMARGIDFKGVQMVINYDLPLTPVAYIHRIGRTGRAGQHGTAVTFFTEDDLSRIRSIANVMKLSGCDAPKWMLTMKPLNTKEKRRLRKSAPLRKHIDYRMKA